MWANEEAMKAVAATGISAADFKTRQEFVKSLQDGKPPFEEEELKSVVLPITMDVGGERKVVGHVLVETVEPGSAILHAVIEGKENVANLLRADLGYLSIWSRSETKT